MKTLIFAGFAMLVSVGAVSAGELPRQVKELDVVEAAADADTREPVICGIYALRVMADPVQVADGERYAETHYPVPFPIWVMMNLQ